MNKQQQNWLHVLFIAIAVIGLLINVGIVFLIGVILEIWHLWRIYQQKKTPGKGSAKNKGAADAAAQKQPMQNNVSQQRDQGADSEKTKEKPYQPNASQQQGAGGAHKEGANKPEHHKPEPHKPEGHGDSHQGNPAHQGDQKKDQDEHDRK